MPTKPKRPCNHPGCPNLTTGKYCKDHAAKAKQERVNRHMQYDRYQRDKQASTFYKSTQWELMRQQALVRDNGLCVRCLEDTRITFATLVDHIVPLRIAWHLRLTLPNLQSLCDRCHAIKTAEDKIKYNI